MKKYAIQSGLLRWLCYSGFFLLIILSILRIVFVFVFKPASLPFTELKSSFLMGLRFDARLLSIVLLLMFLLGSISKWNPLHNNLSKKIFFWVWSIVLMVLVCFYVIDFAHYSYVSARLNAQVLNYLEDQSISLKMVWQSYPVIRMLLGIISVAALLIFVVVKIFYRVKNRTKSVAKGNRIVWGVTASILFILLIWGNPGQYPLRWSDAFSLGSDFKANVALNPVQSFMSSLKFRKSNYSLSETRKYYSLMAAHLDVPLSDSSTLNFERDYSGNQNATKPNVVLVICESFSAYKSSMWGNPLDATPYFNQLSKEGIFFDRCFTPAYGTARGVWATITGVPDVEMPKTASRNPAMVNQSTILNDFKDYEKLYFIGGSTSWANIRGLLMDNINGLHLYEENDFAAPRVDVWGISDHDLFQGALRIMRKKQTPFFSIIQTANNHRPYTIPAADMAEMGAKSFPIDTLKKYGFGSLQEYEAFRYTDYCIKKFMESVKNEPFYKNTIFVFIGDHGIRGDAGNMLPRVWTDEGLTSEHVPLLFYAPGYLSAKRISNIVSQTDVLPSIATIVGIPYQNKTLGRNIFDTTVLNRPDDYRNCSFIIDHDAKDIGIVTNKYFYRESMVTKKGDLFSITSNNKPDTVLLKPTFDSLKQLTQAYYQTALYMLFNNKKK